MVADTLSLALVAGASLAGLGIAALATLKGWREWLDYKRLELAGHAHEPMLSGSTAGGRIEIADLRERVRKLEAIAAGIDY